MYVCDLDGLLQEASSSGTILITHTHMCLTKQKEKEEETRSIYKETILGKM